MEKLATLMYKLFKGRRDTWGARRQNSGEYFRVSGKAITVGTYLEHLRGATIGIYPLVSEACSVAAIDIDSSDLELVKRVCALTPQPNYVERSRSGNYHIWMFFAEPVAIDNLAAACSKAVALARRECSEHCCLYPPRAKGLGLLISLPFHKDQIDSDQTIFIAAPGNLQAQYDFLSQIKYTQAPGSFVDNFPKKLKALWLGTGKKTGDVSHSGYDFSFCVALFEHGFSYEKVKKLLRKRPDVHQSADEYIDKTVEAAYATHNKRVAKQTGTAGAPPRVVDWAGVEALSRNEFIQRLGEHLVLHKQQLQQFDIFYATIMANLKTKGRPVWIMFVGPPGCGKTLPMMAVQYAPYVYMASAFRPTALISGYGIRGSEDMSLIPKLNGKILMVKDMSSLLSQHKEVVAEVLGLLRDVYDGSCSRPFATGVTRTYTSRFGFIGATTPDIDAHWALNVRLGERFLRYRCRATGDQIYEKIDRSLEGLAAEEQVDLEIENICLGFLKHLTIEMEAEAANEVKSPRKLYLSNLKAIGRLAQLGAILRTVVSRSPFGQEVLVIPEWEEATRYAKQLAKMALGLAYIRGKTTNGEQEMNDLKALVRDAMDARIEKICSVVYREPGLEAVEIADRISLPVWTVRTCLDNLAVARVIFHKRHSLKLTWHFIPWLDGQLNKFQLWSKEKGERVNENERNTSSDNTSSDTEP